MVCFIMTFFRISVRKMSGENSHWNEENTVKMIQITNLKVLKFCLKHYTSLCHLVPFGETGQRKTSPVQVIFKETGVFGRPINMMIFFDSMVLTVTFIWGSLSYLIGILANVGSHLNFAPFFRSLVHFMPPRDLLPKFPLGK